MGFFTIVLIVLGVLWLLRRLLPYLLMGFIARKQRQFTEQFGGGYSSKGGGASQASKDQRAEGEVKVEINPETQKEGKSKTIGEYVEFEEE